MKLNHNQKADPEKRHQSLYRILLFLSIPACGFLSAGIAYILYFVVDTIWPYVLIPVSLFILLLLFLESGSETPGLKFFPDISIRSLNRITFLSIIMFTAAFLWWIYYLIYYVELQK